MEEGKLIEVKFRQKMLPITERKGNYCTHYTVEVDSEARILSCEKCGVFLDPFQYILDLAYKERSIHAWIDMLEKERNELFEEKEKLKQQVSYLRSQAKKLNKEQV
jgi:excinuclease UvrABC ATPase subunit